MRGELDGERRGGSTAIGHTGATKLAEVLMFSDLLSIGHGGARGALEMMLLDKESPIKLAGLTMAVVSAKDDFGSANRRLPRGSFVSFECFEARSGHI